jgi:replicative DNA helicase
MGNTRARAESPAKHPLYGVSIMKGWKLRLADLRDSGTVEDDADVVILLHRDDYYDKNSPRSGEADLIIAKHRHGPTDTITVSSQLHLARFVDLPIE